jgi:hypothetical protein
LLANDAMTRQHPVFPKAMQKKEQKKKGGREWKERKGNENMKRKK